MENLRATTQLKSYFSIVIKHLGGEIITMPDLIIHFKKPRGWQDTIKIHYWNTAPSPSETSWPGLPMTAEDNDWFVYRFEGICAASIVFNDGASRQTADLQRDQDGWFCDDNLWYDENPQPPDSEPLIDSQPLTGIGSILQSVSKKINSFFNRQ